MTVQWWWFQTHCSEIRAHLKRVSSCLSSGGWSLKRLQVFFVSQTYVANALYNHLPHQVKRERHYKVYIRCIISRQPSRCALLCSLSQDSLIRRTLLIICSWLFHLVTLAISSFASSWRNLESVVWVECLIWDTSHETLANTLLIQAVCFRPSSTISCKVWLNFKQGKCW